MSILPTHIHWLNVDFLVYFTMQENYSRTDGIVGDLREINSRILCC